MCLHTGERSFEDKVEAAFVSYWHLNLGLLNSRLWGKKWFVIEVIWSVLLPQQTGMCAKGPKGSTKHLLDRLFVSQDCSWLESSLPLPLLPGPSQRVVPSIRLSGEVTEWTRHIWNSWKAVSAPDAVVRPLWVRPWNQLLWVFILSARPEKITDSLHFFNKQNYCKTWRS